MSPRVIRPAFESILALAKPELRPVCQSLRNRIVSLHPEVFEVVWPALKLASYGVGPKKMTEHYAYIAVQGSHINLGFYHGVSLPDPGHRLEGAGKKLRHVKFRDVASVNHSAIAALLREAMRDRQHGADRTRHR